MSSLDNFHLFQKRLKSYSLIPLVKLEEGKYKTFLSALERSYNRELVETEDGIPIRCLISGINTQPKIEKKSFSALAENGLLVGDILYWPRIDSHWIITDLEETEKSIAQGYISQALYYLRWRDERTGQVYDTWACTKGPEETTITDGVKSGIRYDVRNQSLYLMVPKDRAGMEFLDRYTKLFVNGRKWRIEVADRYSYDRLIALQLKEELIDRDKDDTVEQITDGALPFNIRFTSSLDDVTFVTLGQEIELVYDVFKNDNRIMDYKSIIEAENCEYKDGKIIFNEIGDAHIAIAFPEIEKEYEYIITVSDEQQKSEHKDIIGPYVLPTLTTEEFYCDFVVDGKHTKPAGKWTFDKRFFSSVTATDKANAIRLRANNKIGTTTITFTIPRSVTSDEVVLTKEVKIVSIYERERS